MAKEIKASRSDTGPRKRRSRRRACFCWVWEKLAPLPCLRNRVQFREGLNVNFVWGFTKPNGFLGEARAEEKNGRIN